ncbi:MAG: dephospho-CoA kinase [Deltaproteobacteria bacterium]|nr:MAG: dephospho-CoA kinase [Deltaproteobacteria bacterium]
MTTRVIGLTGGIGTGKSTVARMLAEHGATVVDADALAREVVAPGQPALEAIRARFGPEVLTPEGHLDRAALGRIVFSDPEARRALEAITHPRIAELAQRRIETARRRGDPIVVYDAALIVEKGLQDAFDGLLVVRTDPATQIARVMARDGIGREEAAARIAAQLPIEEKVKVADWVIDNSGSLSETRRQVDALWEKWRGR